MTILLVKLRLDDGLQLSLRLQRTHALTFPLLLRPGLHRQTLTERVLHGVRPRARLVWIVEHVPEPLILRPVLLAGVTPRDDREKIASTVVRRRHVHPLGRASAAFGGFRPGVTHPVVHGAVVWISGASLRLDDREEIAAAGVEGLALIARVPSGHSASAVGMIRLRADPAVGVAAGVVESVGGSARSGVPVLDGVEEVLAALAIVLAARGLAEAAGEGAGAGHLTENRSLRGARLGLELGALALRVVELVAQGVAAVLGPEFCLLGHPGGASVRIDLAHGTGARVGIGHGPVRHISALMLVSLKIVAPGHAAGLHRRGRGLASNGNAKFRRRNSGTIQSTPREGCGRFRRARSAFVEARHLSCATRGEHRGVLGREDEPSAR